MRKSLFRIPDLGSEKGTGSRIRNTGKKLILPPVSGSEKTPEATDSSSSVSVEGASSGADSLLSQAALSEPEPQLITVPAPELDIKLCVFDFLHLKFFYYHFTLNLLKFINFYPLKQLTKEKGRIFSKNFFLLFMV
jgi:hypothetical protein